MRRADIMLKRLLLFVLIASCDVAPAPPPPPPASPAASAAAPTYFDPFAAKPGDSIAGVELAALDVALALDSLPSGSATFDGEIELTGEYRPHFDYPEVRNACFWVDSASWKKVPRMRGDSRTQIWFCFRNQEEAIRDLGPLGERSRRTIVIDRYTTNVTRSDVWDEAELVRVSQSTTSSDSSARD